MLQIWSIIESYESYAFNSLPHANLVPVDGKKPFPLVRSMVQCWKLQLWLSPGWIQDLVSDGSCFLPPRNLDLFIWDV